jgi:hypothetical protein
VFSVKVPHESLNVIHIKFGVSRVKEATHKKQITVRLKQRISNAPLYPM